MLSNIYPVPLPMQLCFFLYSFKSANNLKSFVSYYFLTNFLHYQTIVFNAHAQIITSEYKNALSVLHMHRLVIFQNHTHIQNLDRWPGECM